MRKADKVIITCAVTGSIHTPTMSPHLPITPDEIADQSIEAAEAGAAILHLHARDPDTGKPTPDPDMFMQFLPRIKQACGAVVNITTGGGLGMSMEERLAAANRAKPEVASLNMGSMNFGAFQLADKFDWKHDWEKPYLESTYAGIYSNTFAQIEQVMRELGHGHGTRFEFECYDVGHLYTLRWFADQGLVEPPFLIQCVLGVQGGIGQKPDHLLHMKNTADELFGEDYFLSVLAIGRNQLKYLTLSALLGGSVRVGLEDNLFIKKGELAKSNAEAVRKVRSVVEALDLEIASPDEARDMLKLKGGDAVGF